MKKLYAVFLMAVVATVCSLGLSAQSAGDQLNFTLNCDRADAVQYRTSYAGEWQTLAQGDNPITLTYEWGYSMQLKPVDGFRLDEFASADPDSYPDQELYNPLNTNYLNPQANWEGRTYNIVTTNLDEMRTSKVTVNVTDDPGRFEVSRSGGSPAFQLKQGANELRFDPATELPIQFSSIGSNPLYIVRLDGVDVPRENGNRYTFKELTDGQVIDVTSNWPADLETEILISVPEGMESMIKRVYYEGSGWSQEDVTFKVNEPFTVQGGKWYNATFDTSGFVIKKVTLDGEEQYTSSSQRFWAGEKSVKLEVEAVVKVVPKFYLSTERDNEVEYSTNGYSYVKLPAGKTEIEPYESFGGAWGTVNVRALNGFRLKSIECADPVDSYTMPEDPTQNVGLQPTAEWLGRVYEVTAVNLDDERTASVTITVTDDPAKVFGAKRGTSRIELGAAGEAKVFKFNPESSEKTFVFEGNLVPLNCVKVNGVTVLPDTETGVAHTIQVNDGDNIEITAGYPEVEVPLMLNVDPAAAGVVSGVRRATGEYYSESLNFTVGEPIMVPAGSKIYLDYNTSAYHLKSSKIGERELGRYEAFFVLNDPVDVDIDAAEWQVFSFTLNVPDPTLVDIYEGTSTYGATPYELVAGENHLTIEEQEGCFTVKPKSGYQLNSVTDAEGNVCAPAEGLSNVFNVTESGMVFNINVGELQYDSQWVFWLDSADNLDSSYGTSQWSSSEYRGDNHEIAVGYNQHTYAKALDEQFMFQVYLLNGYYLYVNGEFDSKNEWNTNCYFYFTPQNHIDVVRIYTTGEPAEKHDLTFTVSGDKAKETKVVTDLIVDQPAWTEGLSLLEQTRVELTLPEDAENVAVKLDETPLEANEEGKYVFDTTGNHNVTISTSSSILDLNADKASDNNAVYNLMGVKVLDNASAADLKRLPAGVYVVNGEKKVIR